MCAKLLPEKKNLKHFIQYTVVITAENFTRRIRVDGHITSQNYVCKTKHKTETRGAKTETKVFIMGAVIC